MRNLTDLVPERPQDGTFQVSRRLFTDQEIFEFELRHIFEGGWVYLVHESQLPRPNDYFTTAIGRKSILLTRSKSGAVKAFINACTHRGAALCRNEHGNKKVFVCPYHGWSYDADGRNTYIKARESGGYSEQFEQRSHDLVALAQVEDYRGFIFGSLNLDVPPLKEHLAAAAGFIDLLVDQSPNGLEVLKGSTTFRYNGNWKLQAENGVDGYHFSTVHQNYTKVLQERDTRLKQTGEQATVRTGFDARQWGKEAGWYDLGNGHVMIWLVSSDPKGRSLWEQRDELVKRVGESRTRWMVERQRNLMLFPNVQLMDQNSTQIRVIHPLAVDQTEVKSYCFAPRGESPQARERRLRQFEDFFNATGMATPDDIAVFEDAQAGCDASPTRLNSYERGIARAHPGADEDARALGIEPVASGGEVMDETLYHGMYRQWAKTMKAAR